MFVHCNRPQVRETVAIYKLNVIRYRCVVCGQHNYSCPICDTHTKVDYSHSLKKHMFESHHNVEQDPGDNLCIAVKYDENMCPSFEYIANNHTMLKIYLDLFLYNFPHLLWVTPVDGYHEFVRPILRALEFSTHGIGRLKYQSKELRECGDDYILAMDLYWKNSFLCLFCGHVFDTFPDKRMFKKHIGMCGPTRH